jgi:predicted helicase
VRFFRMAERCIVEGQAGHGIVCFISNYSWLDGLSFPIMRERYLKEFDSVWIDCLNGDKYRTGKLTPEGKPDPSVFSTEHNREGIQVGTAVALLVRQPQHGGPAVVRFRNLWGQTKREDLLASLPGFAQGLYQEMEPGRPLGLPFRPITVDASYLTWPLLSQLFVCSSQGVKTSRDLELVEIDEPKLRERMRIYLDQGVSDQELAALCPVLTTSTARYDAREVRSALLRLGIESGHFMRYAYRPFDDRAVYWHPQTKLLDEKRDELFRFVQAGNPLLTCRQKGERTDEGSPFYVTKLLPDYHLTRPGCTCFPLTARGMKQNASLFGEGDQAPAPVGANLSKPARA